MELWCPTHSPQSKSKQQMDSSLDQNQWMGLQPLPHS